MTKLFRTYRARTLVAVALAALLSVAPGAVSAANYAETSHLRVAASEIGANQYIGLAVNKSVIVDLPVDAAEVVVGQPSVAGAIMRSKRRAFIQGIAGGNTNIFFLDDRGNTISIVDIKVFVSRSEVGTSLESAIARNIPGSRVIVESVVLDSANGAVTNRVVISGTVDSQDDANKAAMMAAQFSGSAENVANLITVKGSQQVMLKVTVAEVSRETVKQLGINLGASYTSDGMTTSLLSTQPLGGASNVVTTSAAKLGVAVGPVSLDATLRALERRGAMRTLAEPTLTAMSGQSAEFLAGGEFPVPTGIDEGVITFEFKRFGVQLNFTPTVKSNGVIGLSVDTSVSEPTTEGGFNAAGVTIPATKERKAKTSVELPTGSTLAIAGLMQDQVRQQFNAFPGLGDIPILGALFRSRDFIHSQTELVILVTPYIAEPTFNAQKPTDSVVFAGDAEATFLGHMEKMYGLGGEEGGLRGAYSGSVGFVLD